MKKKDKKLKFLNKRDHNNLLLKYSVIENSSKVSKSLIDRYLNKTSSLRKILDENFNPNLIDLYFNKFFIGEFENNKIENLANQIVINNYDNKNSINHKYLYIDKFVNKIFLDEFLFFEKKLKIKYNLFNLIFNITKSQFTNVFNFLKILFFYIIYLYSFFIKKKRLKKIYVLFITMEFRILQNQIYFGLNQN